MKKWNAIPTKAKGLRFYFDTQYKPARLATSSPGTVYRYEMSLAQIDMFLGRAAMLRDLTDETIAGCEAWLAKEHGLEIGSTCKLRDMLNALWRFLNRRRIVDTWPGLPKIRPPVRIPTAWTPEQLKRLWEYLSRLPGDVAGVPANLWFMALHAILWDTGARVSEARAIRWSDVDLSAGYVVTRAESRKNKLADKLSRLHPETVALLRKILAPRRDDVFPWPFNRTYLHVVYRDMVRRAGLPSGRDRSFHAMRKSCASYVKRFGGPPQEVLGHSDGKLTETVYLDPRVTGHKFAADFLPRLHEVPNAG